MALLIMTLLILTVLIITLLITDFTNMSLLITVNKKHICNVAFINVISKVLINIVIALFGLV